MYSYTMLDEIKTLPVGFAFAVRYISVVFLEQSVKIDLKMETPRSLLRCMTSVLLSCGFRQTYGQVNE